MELKTREKGGVAILDLKGELRLTDVPSPSLQKTILEELAGGHVCFLLNFDKLDFIDSYGIGEILSGYIAVRERGGKLKICCLSNKIWLILNYTGLLRVIETFDSEEKALRSYAS